MRSMARTCINKDKTFETNESNREPTSYDGKKVKSIMKHTNNEKIMPPSQTSGSFRNIGISIEVLNYSSMGISMFRNEKHR